MKIQEAVYKKKKGYIVADGQRYDNLSLSVMLKYSFKEGEDIEPQRFDEFLNESEAVSAKDYLFSLLARGARTEKEAAKKLKEKGFSRQNAAAALELAKSYGYLSDSDFAKNYIDTHSLYKGGYRIKRELKEKGIPSDLSESLINSAQIDELAAACAAAEKFIKNRPLDDKTKERLFRHLAARGFGYDTIKEVLSSIGLKVEEDL